MAVSFCPVDMIRVDVPVGADCPHCGTETVELPQPSTPKEKKVTPPPKEKPETTETTEPETEPDTEEKTSAQEDVDEDEEVKAEPTEEETEPEKTHREPSISIESSQDTLKDIAEIVRNKYPLLLDYQNYSFTPNVDEREFKAETLDEYIKLIQCGYKCVMLAGSTSTGKTTTCGKIIDIIRKLGTIIDSEDSNTYKRFIKQSPSMFMEKQKLRLSLLRWKESPSSCPRRIVFFDFAGDDFTWLENPSTEVLKHIETKTDAKWKTEKVRIPDQMRLTREKISEIIPGVRGLILLIPISDAYKYMNKYIDGQNSGIYTPEQVNDAYTAQHLVSCYYKLIELFERYWEIKRSYLGRRFKVPSKIPFPCVILISKADTLRPKYGKQNALKLNPYDFLRPYSQLQGIVERAMKIFHSVHLDYFQNMDDKAGQINDPVGLKSAIEYIIKYEYEDQIFSTATNLRLMKLLPFRKSQLPKAIKDGIFSLS